MLAQAMVGNDSRTSQSSTHSVSARREHRPVYPEHPRGASVRHLGDDGALLPYPGPDGSSPESERASSMRCSRSPRAEGWRGAPRQIPRTSSPVPGHKDGRMIQGRKSRPKESHPQGRAVVDPNPTCGRRRRGHEGRGRHRSNRTDRCRPRRREIEEGGIHAPATPLEVEGRARW
jgi:hypothetical protein